MTSNHEASDSKLLNEKSNGESLEENNLESKIERSAYEKDDEAEQKEEIKEEGYRWLILVSFCMLSFASGMNWVTIASISGNVQEAYEYSSAFINLFSVSYAIMYLISFPLAVYLLDHKGLIRLGMTIAALSAIVGVGLRLLFNTNIYLALVGQFFCAFAQPFTQISTGKVSSIWFRVQVRTIVCSIPSLFGIIGTMAGSVYYLMMVPSEVTNKEDYKDSVFTYLLSQAILTFVLAAPTIIFFKSKPQNSPSLSQQNLKTTKLSLKINITLLLSNKDFILFTLSYSLIIGYNNSLANIFVQFFTKYNIPSERCSLILLISCITSIITSLSISFLIDKTKNYKRVFQCCLLIGIFTQIVFVIVSELQIEAFLNNIFVVIVIPTVVITSTIGPFQAIGIDYVCELTYPVGELIAGGTIMLGAQIKSIGETYLFDFFLDTLDKRYYVHCENFLCQIITFVMLSFMSIII
mmetsp:Transcript_8852/g.9209  ORF Transcript_8852/g.9209 Transcript_8852/m.9209 type:complete len:466 (+) Transcript_8852:11-1408(+)